MNEPFGDPGLRVDFKFEDRALLFDGAVARALRLPLASDQESRAAEGKMSCRA